MSTAPSRSQIHLLYEHTSPLGTASLGAWEPLGSAGPPSGGPAALPQPHTECHVAESRKGPGARE